MFLHMEMNMFIVQNDYSYLKDKNVFEFIKLEN